MGKIKKGQVCSVEGCNETAVKAISFTEISRLNIGLSFKKETSKGKVYLCKKHYREIKKYLKKSRKLEKWRWGAPF